MKCKCIVSIFRRKITEEAATKKPEELAKAQQHIDFAVNSREARREYRQKNPIDVSKVLAHLNTMSGPIQINLRELGDSDEEAAFAWVLSEGGEKNYIGKHLIYDENYEVLVASWRAEIAAAYYLSNIQSRQGLAAKSRLIHERPNKLVDLDLTIFHDLEKEISKLSTSTSSAVSGEISDSVLSELESNSTGNLKEIIRTIHASQYEIISAKRKGLHVVQGAPGTGKTVVGVHRASWLLYPGNDDALKPEKTLIIGPNDTFIKYMSGLLPTLGETEIKHRSINNINSRFKADAIEIPASANIKADPRMKDVLNRSVFDRIKIPTKSLIYKPADHLNPIEISATDISQKVNEWWGNKSSYNSGKTNFRTFLINSINEQILSMNDGKSRAELFATESSVESMVNQVWPSISSDSVLKGLISNQARLISAAASSKFLVNEISQLIRKFEGSTREANWTAFDIPLLDYLDFLIDGNRETFDLIIVDEAQDLSPMQLDAIRRRSASGDVLLLGDLAQATGIWNYQNWDEISDYLGIPVARLDELLYGYRVPAEVFSYAANVLSHIDSTHKPPILIRHVAEVPMFETFSDSESLLKALSENLKTFELVDGVLGIIATEGVIAVIEKYFLKCNIDFTIVSHEGLKPGINLISITDQKGLECDRVIIVDPQSIIDSSEAGLKQLYVAITRSLKTLAIYALQRIPFQLISRSGTTSSIAIEKVHQSLGLSPEEDIILKEFQGYLDFRGLTLDQFQKIIQEGFNE